jgi:hypothetical protein
MGRLVRGISGETRAGHNKIPCEGQCRAGQGRAGQHSAGQRREGPRREKRKKKPRRAPKSARPSQPPTLVDGVIDQEAQQVAGREVPSLIPKFRKLRGSSVHMRKDAHLGTGDGAAYTCDGRCAAPAGDAERSRSYRWSTSRHGTLRIRDGN